jgi:PAS domain S-box-containing protein
MPVPAEDDARARILIVDDNHNKLRALESLLEPLGAEILSAPSGRDALRHLLASDVAVILLDVRMPEMDGFETAALIRSRPRCERTPILFVTAFDQAEADMARGFELGAVDFVLSPIVPEILRNKVSVLVDLYEASRQVERQAKQLLQLETQKHRKQLARAETGRRRAEERFSTILDIAGDAILAVDSEHRVVVFNRAAERIFGQRADAVLQRDVDELIVGASSLLAHAPEEHATTAPVEVQGVRADETLFAAEASVAPTVDDDRPLWTIILRDVTERRENEVRFLELHDALDQRLRIGIDMVAALAETLDATLVLGRLLVQAASAVRADRGTLVRIDPETGTVKDTHELNHAAAFDRSTPLASQPMLRKAVETRQPVIAPGFEAVMLPAAATAWGGRPRHVAAVPLAAGDAVMAVLLLCREDAAPFSPGDVETLKLIASVAVVALRNADLYMRAEESSQAKSDFLNLAAHELRTPLSVVRGYLSMLIDGSLGAPPSPWLQVLDTIGLKVDELNAIVDNLLTAARAENDGITAIAAMLDLRDLAAEAVTRHAPRAELLHGTIRLAQPQEPVLVAADRALTARILDNLINNALTYSVGPPQVRVRVDGAERAVRVEDRGPGIPDKVRDRVFERFVRADHPQIGPRQGTGLGLYIGRELAARQEASLSLARTGPQGSVFTLAFPPVQQVAVDGQRAAEASGAAVG